MSWRYRILSKSEDLQRETDEASRREMDLAFIAAGIAAMKCGLKTPTIRFILECDDGCVVRHESVDGYCFRGAEIFIKTGLPLVRLIDVVAHEVRHAWQYSQARWANRSDEHCERDAETFVREFWGIRRAEDDFEKLIVTLSEIGAPLAAAAGDFQAMAFFLGELRIAGHPAADKLEKQCDELSRRRVEPITPRSLQRVPAARATLVEEIRKNYYEVILPAHAERFIKPHLRVFEGIYR